MKDILELQRRCMEFLRKSSDEIREMPIQDIQNLVEDLQIHLVQSEIQNEILTQRKPIHDALRESQERFQAIFEQAAVGFAQIETKTGRFIRINKKYNLNFT